MIELNLNTVYYEPGTPILENINFYIHQGEIVALTGASGIGKSTILKIVAGFHTRYTGSIDIKKNSKAALISQNKCLLPWKNVYQNIVLLNKVKGVEVNHNKAMDLIESLGLLGLENKYPLFLSGGQYQRTALGQAFFYEPDILLMDEPFSALDRQTKKEVMDLFLRLQDKFKITTLLVTHSTEEAKYLGSRIVNLEKG
ncbi:MAG: Taurine-transporting ATPase [Anaerocolumna sp.]|nr:Taurine-transporting ATPase [Anaerocolumna sp.]